MSEGSLRRWKSCSPSRTSKHQVSNRRRSAAVPAPPSTRQALLRPSNSVCLLQAHPGMRTRALRNNQVSHQQRTRAQSDQNLSLPRAPPAKNLPRELGHLEQSMSTPVCSAICLMKRLLNALSLHAFDGLLCHSNSVCCRGVLETT